MRAFVINKYAHPSKIPVEQAAPEPQPGPGQVLIDVYSAGLNFFDVGVLALLPPQHTLILISALPIDITSTRQIPDTAAVPFRKSSHRRTARS